MKQKGWLVFFGFVIIFHMIILIQDMPNLVNGHAEYDYIPGNTRAVIRRLFEIAVRSAFPLSAYFLMLKFYPSKQLIAGAGMILVAALIFFLLFAAEPKGTRLRFFFLSNVFYFLLYTVYGIVIFLIQFAGHKELQTTRLMTQQRESELSFLRSQINPHFLFNSLNNIYALVYHKSEKALDAVSGFSDLMRYMLYDANDNIELKDEISYIRKYIDLQQLRFENGANVEISVSGEDIVRIMPPLLFIPFVENAFKHGRVTDKMDGIKIIIHNTVDELHFYCRNSMSYAQKDARGGIGISNVRKRLELLYPEKHVLSLQQVDEHFEVKLVIKNG